MSSQLARGEDRVGIVKLDSAMSNSPGTQRTACQEGIASESSEPRAGRLAQLHSEGIAYKPLCGEIAVCPRVGRMGPIK